MDSDFKLIVQDSWAKARYSHNKLQHNLSLEYSGLGFLQHNSFQDDEIANYHFCASHHPSAAHGSFFRLDGSHGRPPNTVAAGPLQPPAESCTTGCWPCKTWPKDETPSSRLHAVRRGFTTGIRCMESCHVGLYLLHPVTSCTMEPPTPGFVEPKKPCPLEDS